MSKDPANPASVRQRLLNLARLRGEEFQFVLTRYAAERLLVRLSRSPHADLFVLKGALLFELWTGRPHRSTLDVDLLSTATDDVDRVVELFRGVVAADAGDPLRIDPASLSGEPIREAQRYQGVRLSATATLAGARIPLQVDVGFGDAVVPAPVAEVYPALLGGEGPTLKVYPREAVVAEKFEAMASLGMANSRMKDYYDVHVLAGTFEFEGDLLARSIAATFGRRGTPLPDTPPVALDPTFSRDPGKAAQWAAFIRRGRLRDAPPDLPAVVGLLRAFLWPPAEAARDGVGFAAVWHAGSEWQPVGRTPPK